MASQAMASILFPAFLFQFDVNEEVKQSNPGFTT